MRTLSMLTAAALGLTTCSPAAAADTGAGPNGAPPALRLANIFGDGMVLQRAKPVRIWGWAKPGARVTVVLTDRRDEAVRLAGEAALRRAEPEPPKDDENAYRVRFAYVEENAPAFATVKATGTADAAGAWQTVLEPLAATFRPKFLLAVSGGDRVAIRDVLVGEVWLCAGQSNMFYSGNRTKWIDSEGLLAPGVRYAHTGRASHYRPRTDLRERVTWRPCVEGNVRGISTIPYLFGKFLHRRLGVPVGVVNAASGGAQGNYWCSSEQLHGIDFWAVKEMMAEHDRAVADWEDPAKRKGVLAEYERQYAEKLAQWTQAAAEAKARRKRPPRKPDHKPPARPASPFLASYLYNARIAPIGRLAIRGFLYLQGEQQVLTWSFSQYEHVFPAVLRSLRSAFGDEKLPFGIITLQGGGHTKGNLGEVDMTDRHAIVRDMHYRTHLRTPGTGFICAHDVGLGLHPNYKRPVAERAAHWALRDVYRLIPSRHMSVKRIEYAGGRARVHVERDQVSRRRNRDGTWREETRTVPVSFRPWSGNDTCPLSGFMIAGRDRRWYPAKVRCLTKEKALEVWSDLVPEPVALRYGWGDYPAANLGDWEDPLPPFRTDDWPLGKGFGHKPELRSECRSAFYKRLGAQYSNLLDRAIRQGRIDAAICELKLHAGGADILRSKADRIAEILDEMDPSFYEGDRLRWVDERDWRIRREDERRLREAANASEQMKKLLADEDLARKVRDLREALARFRKAVDAAR